MSRRKKNHKYTKFETDPGGSNDRVLFCRNGDELWLYTPPSIPGAAARTCGAPMVIGDYLVDANCNDDFYIIKLENP